MKLNFEPRWVVIFPFLLSVATVTLAMVCLFAGSKPGYMQDIAIVRLNMSMLGANIFGALPQIPGIPQIPGLDGLDLPFVKRQLDLGDIVKEVTEKIPEVIPPAPESSSKPPAETPSKAATSAPTTKPDEPAKESTTQAPSLVDGILDQIPEGIKSAVPTLTPDIKETIEKVIPDDIQEKIPDEVKDITNKIPNVDEIVKKIDDAIPDNVKNTMKTILEDINSFTKDLNFSDGIADELGLQDWYSLHLLAGCEGKFTPNPLDPMAKLTTTFCTPQQVGYKLNITEMLNKELGLGPFRINLADLKFPDTIQEGLNYVNDVIAAITYAYIFGIICGAVSIFGSIAGFAMHTHRTLALAMWVTTGSGTVFLLAGSIMTTIISHGAGNLIRLVGKPIGIGAQPGHTFILCSWASVCIMCGLSVYWAIEFCVARAKARYRRIRRKVLKEFGIDENTKNLDNDDSSDDGGSTLRNSMDDNIYYEDKGATKQHYQHQEYQPEYNEKQSRGGQRGFYGEQDYQDYPRNSKGSNSRYDQQDQYGAQDAYRPRSRNLF